MFLAFNFFCRVWHTLEGKGDQPRLDRLLPFISIISKLRLGLVRRHPSTNEPVYRAKLGDLRPLLLELR